MTKYTLSGLTAEELQAIQEAAPELRIETGEGGIPVSFRREGQGLGVRCAGGVRTIRYDTRNALMRALGLWSRTGSIPVRITTWRKRRHSALWAPCWTTPATR